MPLDGMKNLLHNLDVLSRPEAAVDLSLEAGATVIQANAQRNVRAQGLIDTGRLRGSIAVLRLASMIYAVATNVVYAAIHEFGGTIRAKAGGWLRFKTRDGQWHTVKEVTIPARPYMRPAYRNNPHEIVAAVVRVLRQQLLGGLR